MALHKTIEEAIDAAKRSTYDLAVMQSVVHGNFYLVKPSEVHRWSPLYKRVADVVVTHVVTIYQEH